MCIITFRWLLIVKMYAGSLFSSNFCLNLLYKNIFVLLGISLGKILKKE